MSAASTPAAQSAGRAARVILITRAVSRNQGNVALSRVWHRLLTDAFPGERIATLERIPMALKRYDHAWFAAHADPVAAFDALARRLARRSARAPRTARDDAIMLDPDLTRRTRSPRLRRFKLRTWIARLGSYDRAFIDRQGTLAGGELAVLNAAGEFMPGSTDTPIQYMLDLRIAQLLGLKTAFVNTSFQLADALTTRLAVHTLEAADLVLFRDRVSEARYREAGGTRPLILSPDAAMMTRDPAVPRAPTGRIGLTLAGPLATSESARTAWLHLALSLRRDGLEPVFVTNEWFSDAPIFAAWAREHGFETHGLGLEVGPFGDLLAGLDVVVSARLHTGVLALLAGAGIVPVEIGTTKISGYFGQLGIDAISQNLAGDDHWLERTRGAIDAILLDKAGVVARQQAAIRDAAQAAHADLMPLLAALLPPIARG